MKVRPRYWPGRLIGYARGSFVVVMAFVFLSLDLNAADLVWSSTEAVLNASIDAKTTVVEFAFRNTGMKTVNILSLSPSCDCITAKADKSAYAPGEAGSIHVEFAVDGREGRQERSISVVTDDVPDMPKRLALTIDIPEPVAVRPRAVYWKQGELIDGKTIGIILSEPATTTLDSVQCAEPTFSARIEPLPEPGHYRVQIRPATTEKLAQATIRLSATINGLPRVYVISAGVK